MSLNDIIVSVTVFAAVIFVMIQVKKLLDLRRAAKSQVILRDIMKASKDVVRDLERSKMIIEILEREISEIKRRKK